MEKDFCAHVSADDLPVFASRQHYVLANHGKRTEVSALRYWVASGAGLAGWHAGAGFATLLALYSLLYGRFPQELVNRRRRIWFPCCDADVPHEGRLPPGISALTYITVCPPAGGEGLFDTTRLTPQSCLGHGCGSRIHC